jgi:CHAT domain-containing protein
MNQSLPSAGRRFDLATLSALALPRELRLILRDADFQKLRVIVDGVTANFPWEAVVCNASEVPRLISVLRSISGLAAPSARTGPERSALVIANPEVNSEKYPALPGATEEGAAVAAMLTTVGYATELSSGEPALDVLKRLVMKPYRIVLITGHGEHDAGQVSGGRPTGVVLSGDAVLTAQEFEQMQTAPDIVFLNCPKLGRLAGADSNTSAVDKFLVARLLKFGVRTVIASNWSMDDAAAVRFSKTFFFALLDKGKTVEAAALEARTDALKTSPNDINWATYQLYGDGDYNA